MDWGIMLLGDPDISYLSHIHAVAHVHSYSLSVCVPLSPLRLCTLALSRTIKPPASLSALSLC